MPGDLGTAAASLAQMNSVLARAFASRAPSYVSDAPEIVSDLRESGLEAYAYEELDHVSPRKLRDVVAIAVSFDSVPEGKLIEAYLGESAMLVLPIASFSGSVEGARYMLKMLSSANLDRCVTGLHDLLEAIEVEPTLRFKGGGTDLLVDLPDEVCLMAPKTDTVIQPGEWVSIAQYLEVGLINTPGRERPAHTMNGIFVAPGHVVAYHRHFRSQVEATARLTWDGLNEIRRRHAGAPIVLRVDDSRLVSLTCGDEDILDWAQSVIDPNNRTYVSEFGMAATSDWPVADVSWDINSQINEAIGGLHLGLGRGVTGAHIDLVAPQAQRVSRGA